MIQENMLSRLPCDCELRSPAQVILRDLEPEDLKGVASIHLAAFPDSALTKLGFEAVRRYYQWLLEGPHEAIQLGAFVGSEMVGFCFAGLFQGAMSGFLGTNRVFLFSRVLTRPWMALNPIFRDRIIGAVRILKKSKNKPATLTKTSTTGPRPFGVLAIAVKPNQQGLGVGRLLMQEAEAVARQRGFQEMILTVSTSNNQAIRFYENLQWVKIVGEHIWHGGMKKLLHGECERVDSHISGAVN